MSLFIQNLLTILGLSCALAVRMGWAVFVFRERWIRESPARTFAIQLLTVGFSLLLFFISLEGVFRFFAVLPDGLNFTLSSKLWFARYWNPINSLEYRDREHPFESLIGKKVVFVIGDSFVAGHGIERVRDRFSDRLQEKLGSRYEVVVIAQIGWQTDDEFRAIVSYPIQPRVLILSHHMNDILGAAQMEYLETLKNIEMPTGVWGSLVDHSYWINFVYWRWYRFSRTDVGEKFWSTLISQYRDDPIWKAHQEKLMNIVCYAENFRIPLVVVLFPYLSKVEASSPYTKQVADWLETKGVETIDLGERLRGRNPKELMVNPMDPHPGIALNREIADLLFDWFQKKGI